MWCCLREHTHAGWVHWLQTGGWSSSQCTEPSSGAWGWGRSPPPFVGSLEAWRKGKIREDTTLMCSCNTTLQCISSLLNGLSQHPCNTWLPPLDGPGLTVKECECCCSETVWEGRDLLGALLERLDQHLLEGADLLQVSQNEGHICTAQPAENTVSSQSWGRYNLSRFLQDGSGFIQFRVNESYLSALWRARR